MKIKKEGQAPLSYNRETKVQVSVSAAPSSYPEWLKDPGYEPYIKKQITVTDRE
jgi:hypothetical protein